MCEPGGSQYLTIEMTQTLIDMSRLLAMDAVIILVGMMWDLAVGIRKAMERGEARTSYGLARTATKMLTYYGAFGIGACIDVLLHVGRMWHLFGLADTLETVPVVATLIAIFLCVIEGVSILENADTKAKKRMGKVADVALTAASKTELVELLARAITAAQENTKKEDKDDAAG